MGFKALDKEKLLKFLRNANTGNWDWWVDILIRRVDEGEFDLPELVEALR
jgi:hypothetical protein